MSQTRVNPKGLNYERKRSPPAPSPLVTSLASSTSSALSRPGYTSGAHAHYQDAPRSPSPPASTYFPTLARSQDEDVELTPTADAGAHFAYSTTLRRHHVEGLEVVNAEAISLWQRLVSTVTGQPPMSESEGGRYEPVPSVQPKDTPSARFAHLTVQETLSIFRVSTERGLDPSELSTLRATHGYNEFSVSTPEPLLLKFAKTIYESPLILLLCGSAVVSAVMGNIDDAISITVAVLIVLTVGFVQERRSEKSLEALNKLVPHHCHVLRHGQSIHVLANELVPGDVVTFQTGDRVPADVRLTSAVNLEIDESSLTGETNARTKSVDSCGREVSALADRTCIAYMGTLVRNGRGSGVVVAIGGKTEFGVVFEMMQEVEEKRTPLQLSMDELAKNLSMLSFGIIGIIVLIGVLQKRSWLEMFTIGVSLAVAAIPEGLPIVTTVTLALGVLRMAKRKAIVKRLHSVEALGSVSVICSDKTGTLTKNEQTVTEIYAVDETIHIDPNTSELGARKVSPALKKTLEIGALCNNASTVRNEEGSWMGQSTDVALLNVLDVFGIPDLRPSFTRTSERPFSSEHKSMSISGHPSLPNPSINGVPREVFYMKGSIDAILDRCKFYYVSDDSTPALDTATRGTILRSAGEAAGKGLRVIGMAYGYGAHPLPNGSLVASSQPASRAHSPPPPQPSHLIFAGFQAMLDPPRKGVSDAIALLQSGGVQVIMITGDAPETALSIARTLGLRVGRVRGEESHIGSGGSGCLTGQEIDGMNAVGLREAVRDVSVFARTTPRHKMRIVEALQARGKVVAMTGDGVNDAPALKMADIGVSMGKSGTDVAKEAADVILVDDNFSTILPAVEEGKSIFHNIQNFLSFQLSTALAALTLITLSTLFGLQNPLNAMQILFINILMDGPPSQSLGVDPVDPVVMRKPPRRKDEPIITRRLMGRVGFSAACIVGGTLGIYVFMLEGGMSRREQTMTFTCFVFLDLVSALQNRGLGCHLTQNRMLLTTVSVSFIVQLALVYVPAMQAVFQTEALEFWDLGMLLALGGLSFGLHEARRRWEREKGEEEWRGVVEDMA